MLQWMTEGEKNNNLNQLAQDRQVEETPKDLANGRHLENEA